MRGLVVLGTLAAGCGRVGFEPVDGTRDGLAIDAATCPSCEQGLIARWHLDESAGASATDDIGGHTGTLDTGASWLPSGGVIGGAVEFDNAFVTTPLDLAAEAGGRFAVTLWVKLAPSASSYDRLFSQFFYTGQDTGALLIDISLGNGLRCAPNLGTTWPFVEIEDVLVIGQWHHIACMFDGTTVRSYIDGVMRREFLPPGGPLALTSSAPGFPTIIGASESTTSIVQNELSGLVDEVRVYNRNLTAAEVAALATP